MSVYSIDELRSIITDIAGQYGVKKVALFGSYATELQTPESDIDLLINKGSLKGLFKFNAFVNELETKLGKKVDVITYSSLEHSTIKDSVKNEIVLYEQKK